MKTHFKQRRIVKIIKYADASFLYSDLMLQNNESQIVFYF